MFFADNCIEYVVSVYGTAYLGAVPLTPSKPANGPFEMAEQIVDSNATVLIYGHHQEAVIKKAARLTEYSEALGQIKLLVALGDGRDEKSEHQMNLSLKDIEALKEKKIVLYSDLFAKPETAAASLITIPYFPVKNPETEHALIVYTSGTSGRPKGAIHSHRSFIASICNLIFLEHLHGFKLALQLPIGHLSGTCLVPQSFKAGMTVVLFADTALEPILAAVHKYRIEVVILTANVASQLATEHAHFRSKFDLDCLVAFRYGGSQIADHLLQKIQSKYGTEIWNIYASTEMVGSVNILDRSRAAPGDDFVPGCLGVPSFNVQLKIVDLKDGKRALPEEEMGEICFRGPPCFLGYLNNEAATRETIDPEGWYHTGDCGRWDPANGGLFTVDRLKELVKFRHWSIVPAEVEHFLLQSVADLAEACVVGVPHKKDGQWLRAYVQRKENSSVKKTEILDIVKSECC